MSNYGTQILHLSYSYVRDRQTAEDLTQEIFVKCYEKLHTFNGNSSIETWLYRIAANHCKDYLKSWQFRRVRATGLSLKGACEAFNIPELGEDEMNDQDLKLLEERNMDLLEEENLELHEKELN
jgi:RNA polymerase sigma factor (sigma-70 family)